MTLTYYDPNTNQGIGVIYYPGMENTNPIYPFSPIYADIEEIVRDITFNDFLVCCRYTPFIHIQNPQIIKPFTSTPDTRKKFGTYAFWSGLRLERFSGSTVSYEIYESPSFLIYPDQSLGEHRLQISSQYDGVFNYEVAYESSLAVDLDSDILTTSENFDLRPTQRSGNGFTVYLQPGLIAEMVISYEIEFVFSSNSDTRTKYIYIL
jgi:hypothetical protein